MRRLTVPLDGAPVAIGDGTPRLRSLRIPAGAPEESDLPFRVRLDGEREHLVTSLPWQVVGVAGELERLSPVVPGANWDLTQRLPAGLTLRSNPPFQSKTGEGWTEASGEGSPQTIVSGSTPTGDDSFLRQSYAGVSDGNGPYRMFTGFSGTPNRIFFATIARLGPNFVQVPNELKWLTWANDPGNGWLGMYRPSNFLGDASGPSGSMILRMFHRPGGSEDNDQWNRLDLHGATTPIPIGDWFKVSLDFTIAPARIVCHIDYDDGSGGLYFDTNDGIYQGSLSDPLTTFTWSPGAERIVEILKGTVWGGGNGGPGSANEYIDYDASVVYTD